MAIKRERKFPEHLVYIRGNRCDACDRQDTVVAHHVRIGTDGGMGMKPSDFFCIPLCDAHHKELHQHGERTFETKFRHRWRRGLKHRAIQFALLSPDLDEMRPHMEICREVNASTLTSPAPDPQTTK
jgi:hypothetical protein